MPRCDGACCRWGRVRACKLSDLRLARSDESKQPEALLLRFLPDATQEHGGTWIASLADRTRELAREEDDDASPEGDRQGEPEDCRESSSEEQGTFEGLVAVSSAARCDVPFRGCTKAGRVVKAKPLVATRRARRRRRGCHGVSCWIWGLPRRCACLTISHWRAYSFRGDSNNRESSAIRG